MRKAALYLALSGCFLLALVLESLFTRPPDDASETAAAITLGGDGALVEIPEVPPDDFPGDPTPGEGPPPPGGGSGKGSTGRPPGGETSGQGPGDGASPLGTYVVQKGDSLWSIAESQLDDGSRWTEIAALNGLTKDSVLRLNRKLMIPVGNTPVVPLEPERLTRLRTHVVAAGDTLGGLAQQYLGTHVRWTEIRDLNGLRGETLSQGLVLRIPPR